MPAKTEDGVIESRAGLLEESMPNGVTVTEVPLEIVPGLKRKADGPESETKRRANGVKKDHVTSHKDPSTDSEAETDRNDVNTPTDLEDSDEEDSDQARQEAVAKLTEIEVQFARFRDQLHASAMAKFASEIAMCDDGTHPELEQIYEKIKKRRDERVQRNQAALNYRLQAITNRTKAMRCHTHQQFLKDRYDLRAELLCKTTREWYQVNEERRAADKLVPEYGYRPENNGPGADVGLLVALAKYVGFPTAPSISGGTDNELESDMIALGLRPS